MKRRIELIILILKDQNYFSVTRKFNNKFLQLRRKWQCTDNAHIFLMIFATGKSLDLRSPPSIYVKICFKEKVQGQNVTENKVLDSWHFLINSYSEFITFTILIWRSIKSTFMYQFINKAKSERFVVKIKILDT